MIIEAVSYKHFAFVINSTQKAHDVVLTLIQRCSTSVTLLKRRDNVVCIPGIRINTDFFRKNLSCDTSEQISLEINYTFLLKAYANLDSRALFLCTLTRPPQSRDREDVLMAVGLKCPGTAVGLMQFRITVI